MALRQTTEIPGILVLTPKKSGDHRGFFSEVFKKSLMAEHGFTREFVQDNQSLSVKAGVLRGLHFQSPPFAQDKLVRVVRGSIFDVAVDLRKGSPTYGDHVAVTLSAENWTQLLVPIGFAHGFVTLEPNTEVVYKVTDYYAPAHDHGVLWSDPDIGVAWPIVEGGPVLSDKDLAQPRFADIDSPFVYDAA